MFKILLLFNKLLKLKVIIINKILNVYSYYYLINY